MADLLRGLVGLLLLPISPILRDAGTLALGASSPRGRRLGLSSRVLATDLPIGMFSGCGESDMCDAMIECCKGVSACSLPESCAGQSSSWQLDRWQWGDAGVCLREIESQKQSQFIVFVSSHEECQSRE